MARVVQLALEIRGAPVAIQEFLRVVSLGLAREVWLGLEREREMMKTKNAYLLRTPDLVVGPEDHGGLLLCVPHEAVEDGRRGANHHDAGVDAWEGGRENKESVRVSAADGRCAKVHTPVRRRPFRVELSR